MKKLICLFFLFCLGLTGAQASSFEKLTFFQNVSVEVPSHWRKNDQDMIKNIKASAEALVGDMEKQTGLKSVTVLAVDALPLPTKAIVRLSYADDKEFSQIDFSSASPQDVQEMNQVIKPQLEAELTQGLAKMGSKLIQYNDVEVVKLSGHYGILMSYIRSDIFDPEQQWLVRIYNMPYGNGRLLFTLSYNLHQQKLYRPILDKVLNSFNY